MSATNASTEKTSILIIGTGFSGLCMGVQLKKAGIEDFVLLERGDDVGGTWRDNHYPGAACDVPSTLYSFSFEPNPEWSRSFPTQPELFEYQRHVARKYGLTPHVRLKADVQECRYDETTKRWTVTAKDGRVFEGSVVVSGMGGLSNPSYPNIPGLDQFEGDSFHSATWNHDFDLLGKRVAVIGTGASAIQFVPQIAGKVSELHYFQRTPPWVLPKADGPVRGWEKAMFRALPFTQKIYRACVYGLRECYVLGFTAFPKVMAAVEWLAKAHIHRYVKDPVKRQQLTPNYRAGCKRVLLSNDYYQAVARPNVNLVTDGIQEVRGKRVVTKDGTEREVDAIIFGTGFKIQELAPKGTFIGTAGRDLADVWQSGVEAYRGTTISGFPNLFMMVGPNTGVGHTSIIYVIESQARYVVDAIKTMRDQKLGSVDVRPEVLKQYNDKVQSMLVGTVWNNGGCKSWYLSENGRNNTLWPTFTFRFRSQLKSFDQASYQVKR